VTAIAAVSLRQSHNHSSTATTIPITSVAPLTIVSAAMRLVAQVLCLLPIVFCQQAILGKSKAIHITKPELDSLPESARDVIVASNIPVRYGAKTPESIANGTTLASQFAFKYVAGALKGNVVWCQCTNGVNDQSIAFVSASEVGQGNTPFIGSAKYTVHNVAPRTVGVGDSCIRWCAVGGGVIDVWFENDFANPIETILNFLVINN
jgi:hypothetical protein